MPQTSDFSIITATALLESLARRGAVVSITGDEIEPRLHVAPSDALNDEDRANIRRLKPELLDLLQGAPANRWNPQKVQKPTSGARPPAPLRLLDELERRGLSPSASGHTLILADGDEIPLKLRAPVCQHAAALVALLRFRQHAETRRRFEHWVCPDRELLDLWKAAEIACACRLTIAGAWSKTNPKREKKIADDEERS